jgi:hypothetical protein
MPMERTGIRVQWPSDRASEHGIWSDIPAILVDPDLLVVCVFALAGLLLTLCLARAVPFDDNIISAIALLS